MITPEILGDVHLGRKFIEYVPLHRRGHREQMIMAEFKTRLAECTSPLFVQTGDLFDGFSVDDAVVLETALAVREEAKKNPSRIYVFYRGNHDASKDANKASSFDVFAELMFGSPNVMVLKEPTFLTRGQQLFGFIPWSPFKSSEELAKELIEKASRFEKAFTEGASDAVKFYAVFGHWDTESFGGSEFNLVPTKILAPVTDKVVTGHIHTPSDFKRDGVEVYVIGSMQPYSHAEDPNNEWYKTTTFAEYQAYGPTEKAWCRNLNLRVLVREGENPEPCDCLSFRTKLVKDAAQDDEAPDLDVKIEDFSMDNLFHDVLRVRGVGASVQEQISAKWEELKNA